MKELGDRNGEANCYGNLGSVFRSTGEYVKAKEYHEKALPLMKELGDRNGEAKCYVNLGKVFRSIGDYVKAKEYLEKVLPLMKELGDRNGEANCYLTLATVFEFIGEYVKAKEYLEKALQVMKELGDRHGEANCYVILGAVFKSIAEYVKAKEYLEKALSLMKELGDRNGEAKCYVNLGAVFESIGEYVKAKEYLEEALLIMKELGDRNGEANCYLSLGNVFASMGEYVKVKEYSEEALLIMKELGDRHGEAECYDSLGTVFGFIGEYAKAEEYIEMALKIMRNIGNRNGFASCYVNLGQFSVSLGKYSTANKYLKIALAMTKKMGDREKEARCYSYYGQLFQSLGDYDKSKEHIEKSLVINKEIGHKEGETWDYILLGSLFRCQAEYVKAEEYLRKGLALSEESGFSEGHLTSLCELAYVKLDEGKAQEARTYLLPAIQKAEYLRRFLGDDDQFKILYTDKHVSPYWLLRNLFCAAGNFKEALSVSELGRARALADLMSAQYCVENQISAEPQTWASIERIVKIESSCTCLYMSYSPQLVFLWILKPSGVLYFRKVNARNVQEGLTISNLDEFFAKGSFRSFGILPGEHCEDRSLNEIQMKHQSYVEDSHESLRKNNQENFGPKQDLPLCYKLIIAPVVDLLDGPEVIIVPDRSLCGVPFAALPDEKGKCFAEKFRVRVVPSLSTLKLIQDSPADYHSQTGALIVGNPDVGRVRLNGLLKDIPPLPCAESEAIMVGKMLGVKPLLGKEATKQAVLQKIPSVSLIHFAAHGDAERGEILLTPSGTSMENPREDDYLLTMTEVSQVQLRAKLVVLSCCHSAHGQIRAEGVVGIARAFLGSGARSVLVSLWALDDNATEQFMRNFYEHLVRGEIASECLHQAMKWMRDNDYPDVNHWAPFVLIGDSVAFDFKNK
ncbi:tetratricopeptide repeat protein 28-like [Oculina patagonica]